MTIDDFREQAITYILAFTAVYKKAAVKQPDAYPLELESYTEWEDNFVSWTNSMEYKE